MLEGLLERTRRLDRRAEYEAELACPPLPRALVYLWEAFWRLRRRIAGTGFGPAPIGWPEIDAFVRHARIDLAPWEVEIIEMLDDLYMAEQARRYGTDAGSDKD